LFFLCLKGSPFPTFVPILFPWGFHFDRISSLFQVGPLCAFSGWPAYLGVLFIFSVGALVKTFLFSKVCHHNNPLSFAGFFPALFHECVTVPPFSFPARVVPFSLLFLFLLLPLFLDFNPRELVVESLAFFFFFFFFFFPSGLVFFWYPPCILPWKISHPLSPEQCGVCFKKLPLCPKPSPTPKSPPLIFPRQRPSFSPLSPPIVVRLRPFFFDLCVGVPTFQEILFFLQLPVAFRSSFSPLPQ